MSETLLSASNILLFGRPVKDLEIKHGTSDPTEEELHRPFVEQRRNVNKLLEKELSQRAAQSQAKLARIYAFGYEGQLYELARPTIFLVHGDGEPAEDLVADKAAPGFGGHRQSRGPDVADKTGVAAQPYSFSEDMRVLVVRQV